MKWYLSRQKYFIQNWGLSVNRFGFFLCILLWPIISIAEISIKQLNNIVTATDYLEGRFSQEKYLSDVDATLYSSGVFNYQRDQSIRWETLEPIQNILMMTPQSIINTQGGHEIAKIDVKTNPAIAILSEIFFSVLTAKWEALATYFSLSGTLLDQQWQVELIPIDKAMTQAMSRIALKGDTYLRELIIYEKNGDRTTIHFENLSQ